MEMLKGRIVEIEKNVHTGVYIKQGVKENKQYEYENNPKTPGGNGTYAIGHEYYGTTIDVKVYVYDLDKCFSWDIKDYILVVNNKKRISEKLLNYVIKNNKGKKVKLQIDGQYIGFYYSQLEVACNY
ncbi:hypothetical protein [Clostridium ljungdahlii]|uniref:Uncharacterized protein n=1 Tax=Clostridium ljungdahlii TaxID=1538 RepID=A0A162KW44_9CLOT|nr:hypothetical protein [Clostridium ljungdahlii]OAA87812.1 hypothetical protein WY13_01927 [Clostridium ljungdahlii]